MGHILRSGCDIVSVMFLATEVRVWILDARHGTTTVPVVRPWLSERSASHGPDGGLPHDGIDADASRPAHGGADRARGVA